MPLATYSRSQASSRSSKLKVFAVLKGARAFADFKTELDRLLEEAAKPHAEAAPAGGTPKEMADSTFRVDIGRMP